MANTHSTTSSIVPALILFVFVFAVFGMAATGPGSTTPIDPPVADSSVQQRVVRKRRQKRMVYGFTFSHKELVEWGKQNLGMDEEELSRDYNIRRSMRALFTRCHPLWHRTTIHFVTYYSGPHRHHADWCLTLADNISPDTATPPPREVIDEIKEALEITRDPEWHLFGGD
ncbi:hypothetical protein EDB89DRAFT_2243567 [Lactarius sanguifluus]|nr:hypothetical protein EDB89DRAFT_2243567 [Lactarius sanguifluus]